MKFPSAFNPPVSAFARLSASERTRRGEWANSRILLLTLLVPCLLAASAARAADPAPLHEEVRLQIEELQAEKAGRTPAQQKLESRLIYAVKKQRKARFSARMEKVLEKTVKVEADGTALVDISATVTPGLLEALKTAGAQGIVSVPRFRSVRARVPLAQVEKLAGHADVRFIKQAVQALTRTGPINSEGDVAHGTAGATGARAAYNVSGFGVKIGVLSDSVDYLTDSQAGGELGPVTVLDDLPGESGEGTAMLEIIHDLAPGAELMFATAFHSAASFAQNILNLRAAGCDIIVDDIFYFDESPFQNGPIAEAVEQVSADGALVFSAAGNEGNKNRGTSGTWEGDFADGGATTAPITKAGRLHSFGGSNYNVVTGTGFGETLFWSDPLGGSMNDYDLYVLNSTGTAIVAFSNTTQNGTQDPVELIAQSQQPIAAGNRLVVVKAATAAPRFLQVSTIRGTLATSTHGKVSGHSACASVISVAAVSAAAGSAFNTANRVETFSSDGPRRMFYHTDGTAITPGNVSGTGGVVLQKPDLAAADGVATSVPFFDPFYGTSAAAPHAAAIAALFKSQNLRMSAQELRAALLANAIDIEAPGFDRDTGHGLVQPAPTLLTIPAGPKLEKAGVELSEAYSPANGVADPGEQVVVALTLRNTGGAANGNLRVTLVPTPGMTNLSGPQIYAFANGQTERKTFSFTANAVRGGSATLTFHLQDDLVTYPPITHTLASGAAAASFSNAARITINDYNYASTARAATPYPSPINVAGVPGKVGKVTVRLNGFTHTYPGDMKALLVGPDGTAVMLTAYGGGGTGATLSNVTFDDEGSLAFTPSLSGTYRPLDNSVVYPFGRPFPAAAPTTWSADLASFIGTSPNGSWFLYVVDDGPGDVGAINGGWTLNITPAVYSSSATGGADLAVTMTASSDVVQSGQQIVYKITVSNNGTSDATGVRLVDAVPAGVDFTTFSISQGSGVKSSSNLTVALGTIPAKSFATVTIQATATAAGSFANTASVTATSEELDATNNSATVGGISGRSNLTLVQPAGWSDRLVISSTPGTHTDSVAAATPLYLDFAVGNAAPLPANAYFTMRLFVDGVLTRTIQRQLALAAGGVYRVEDLAIPPLTPGGHALRIQVDATGAVSESNEADNEYTRYIGYAAPTLAGFSPAQILEDGVLTPVALVVGTAGTAPGSVIFSASSNNPALVPDGSISFGSGANGPFFSVTPLPDASGTAVIKITATAQDGQKATADLALTVLPVNDAPTIATPPNLDLQEDAGVQIVNLTGISAGGGETQSLFVTVESDNPKLTGDPQIAYASPNTTGTLTFTPTSDTYGSATITVTVSDNGGTTNGGVGLMRRSFNVVVAPVNDPPTLNAIANVTVLEDAGAQQVTLTGVSPGPQEGDPLTFSAVSSNPQLIPNPAVTHLAGEGTAGLTFTAGSSLHGTATITVTINDGQAQNNTVVRAFVINVTPVNDAPSFVKGPDIVLLEDAGAQVRREWATQISPGPADEAEQTVEFLVSSDQPGLFATGPAIAPDGTLSFTPATNANGTATISVRLRDNGGTADGGGETSAEQTFTIALTPVNDAPFFTAGSDQMVLQTAGQRVIPSWATEINAGAADEADQSLEFLVSADQPGLFTIQPAIARDGTLTYTPAGDTSGVAKVTVRLRDGGGTESAGADASAPHILTISIGAVNESPSFTKGANQTAAQDAARQAVAGWATNIKAGPADEAGQVLDFRVTTSEPQFFRVPPAISPDGTLTYTPAAKASGTATVTVVLHDNGGTAEGGSNVSAPQTFTIAVTTFLEETGTYNGLATAAAGLAPTHAAAGLIRVQVLRSGAFSAVLRQGGRLYIATGAFDKGGVATFGRTKLPAHVLKRPGLPDLQLQLQLDVGGGSDQLTGTLSENGQPFATIVADRALYTLPRLAKAPFRAVPPEILGRYTVILPAKSPQETGRAANTYPQGDGAGTLVVDARGRATLRAYLPDGSRVVCVNSLSKTNIWPLYIPLNRNAGSLSGPLTFRDRADLSDFDALALQWFKPATATRRYPLGWMSGLELDLLGSKYAFKPGRSVLTADPAQPLGTPQADGNVTVTLTGGSLGAAGLLHPLNLSQNDRSSSIPGEQVPLSLGVIRSTGLVTGRFRDPVSRRLLTYFGYVFQKQGMASGFFLDTKESGSFILTPRPVPASGAAGGEE